MTRRTDAQIAADAAEREAAQQLHAQAAADHIRDNPDTEYSQAYRELAARAPR